MTRAGKEQKGTRKNEHESSVPVSIGDGGALRVKTQQNERSREERLGSKI